MRIFLIFGDAFFTGTEMCGGRGGGMGRWGRESWWILRDGWRGFGNYRMQNWDLSSHVNHPFKIAKILKSSTKSPILSFRHLIVPRKHFYHLSISSYHYLLSITHHYISIFPFKHHTPLSKSIPPQAKMAKPLFSLFSFLFLIIGVSAQFQFFEQMFNGQQQQQQRQPQDVPSDSQWYQDNYDRGNNQFPPPILLHIS